MKKVIVSEYVYEPPVIPDSSVVAPLRKPSLRIRGVALFHQFGVDYEEFESGPGNYTTAVIEWPDGSLENIPVNLVRFEEPSK